MLQLITIRQVESYQGHKIQAIARVEKLDGKEVAFISASCYNRKISNRKASYRETVDGAKIFAGKVY